MFENYDEIVHSISVDESKRLINVGACLGIRECKKTFDTIEVDNKLSKEKNG